MNVFQYLLKSLRNFRNLRRYSEQNEQNEHSEYSEQGEIEGPSITDSAPPATPVDEAKNLIEQRYRRIQTAERRPSLEYISSEDILHVFLNFVEDKEALLQMTPSELQLLFDKWYLQVYLTRE